MHETGTGSLSDVYTQHIPPQKANCLKDVRVDIPSFPEADSVWGVTVLVAWAGVLPSPLYGFVIWANHLTSMCLRPLVCKMGVITLRTYLLGFLWVKWVPARCRIWKSAWPVVNIYVPVKSINPSINGSLWVSVLGQSQDVGKDKADNALSV